MSTISRCTDCAGIEFDDLDDVDQLVELLGHLLERDVLAVDDDRLPGDLVVLRRSDGERVDVEAAPENRLATRASTPGLFSTSTARVWRAIVIRLQRCVGAWCRGRLDLVVVWPAGTIGPHHRVLVPREVDTTTGRSSIAIAFSYGRVDVRPVSQRSPTQP
jgi:hypothetical protein